jgi:Tfp pilus assembly protein PilV
MTFGATFMLTTLSVSQQNLSGSSPFLPRVPSKENHQFQQCVDLEQSASDHRIRRGRSTSETTPLP